MNNYNNPAIDRLPNHLKQYIVEQHYGHYTPVDHAVWRYVMRQNYSFLKDIAYYPYIPGLKKAGLSIECIPDLQTMNDHLKQISWGAVTVNGFIPSQAFMEFQAYRVLIIAADIRQIDHIAYTPAPDIIHESAGHAPIIGEPEYATYLQFTGEVGTKALISARDQDLFEVIRKLAILKELAGASKKELKKAEEELAHIQATMGEPSEMALLARLHWWTVEYGLIGTVDDYKIYGAGLLSSIGESASCLRPEVKKLPYTINAMNYAYDITRPQPQLFVTPHFDHLVQVLNQFADGLAWRRGGGYGLQKAIGNGLLNTVRLDSGVEISGVFVASDEGYIQTTGPTALALNGKQIEGQGKAAHPDGFGMPVGNLAGFNGGLQQYYENGFAGEQWQPGSAVSYRFASGVSVTGTLRALVLKEGKPLLMELDACTVLHEKTGRTLFQPGWGSYTLVMGREIKSVYCGAADIDAFEQTSKVPGQMPVSVYDRDSLALHELYRRVREIRETGCGLALLPGIWKRLKTAFKEDWLCPLEVLEILREHQQQPGLQEDIRNTLLDRAGDDAERRKLVQDGLNVTASIVLLPGAGN